MKALTNLLAGLLLLPLSCQSPPEPTDSEAQLPALSLAQIRLLEPRIDAIAGRSFLSPVQLTPPITPIGAVQCDLTADGGEQLNTRLLWISRSRPGEPSGPTPTADPHTDPFADWLDAPPVWSAQGVDQLVGGEPPPGNGFWALLVDCPASAHQQPLVLNGRAIPVRWLSTTLPERPGIGAALFQDPSPQLRRTLTHANRDPLNRWRVRLLEDRFNAPRQSVIDAHVSRFAHVAIETMAQQAEWRWRLALDRVSSADPFLGAELLDRLTAVASFQGGAQAPIWPTDDAALSSLRTMLLDANATDEQVITATRAALDAAPEITAWVIDDAGWVAPATTRTVSLVGVAERTGAAGLVRTSAGADRSGPMTTLPGFGVARTTVQAPSFVEGQSFMQHTATASVVGRSAIELPLLPVGLPIEPPGFRLGPGFSPWTLERWTAMTPRSAPDGLSFFALLHRRAGEQTGWQLHIECPVTNGADPGNLRVYLGPTNEPRAILRIDPAGLLQDELNAPLERDQALITQRDGAWIATIDIPEHAIESRGILRLAIERFNASGERATWPRPVMPWQDTPGRAALDCGAWNSLDTSED